VAVATSSARTLPWSCAKGTRCVYKNHLQSTIVVRDREDKIMRERKPFFNEFDRKFGILMVALLLAAAFVGLPVLL
jgi:hypothetical protein